MFLSKPMLPPTYVLLYVLLSRIYRALSQLETHLCGWVVYEATKGRMEAVCLA